MLLWDILVRSQLGFAVAFLEEIWSRNLGHLMMSPLRPAEFIAALMIVSLIKLLVAMVPVAALAYFFFGFSDCQSSSVSRSRKLNWPAPCSHSPPSMVTTSPLM